MSKLFILSVLLEPFRLIKEEIPEY
jgi:hypothetical protein